MQNLIYHFFFAGAFGAYDPSHLSVYIHHFKILDEFSHAKSYLKTFCQGFIAFLINFIADFSLSMRRLSVSISSDIVETKITE